ncbi:probable inactive receptor kinase At1g48480 [Triticum urartu]|uniref:probable inactive receptor kinase At1g48480 n=1 Tax=Triticum urartu TaxID=4572 RepID=UPI002044B198|nr:probable inactive receptor kinase At1g48480 [Triticum urartu]
MLRKVEFEQHITLIGSIQNNHIVPLRWYYRKNDERLLLYDFISMGSLAKALHGKGSGPAPLDWEQRLAISLAAARGVQAIHLTGPSSCHGNIKSSNILRTGTHDACVSEHGLITLLDKYSNASGYRAPEVTSNRRVSQKADVYSFGILLLELLTCKAPVNSTRDMEGARLAQWVRSIVHTEWTALVFDVELRGREKDGKEECMVRLLWLALNCCSEYPNKRPTMPKVVQQIEEIRRESKLAPAKTPSLESSSSCQNMRTVAPAEKMPSQESSDSTPKTGIVAALKAALSQHVKLTSTQNVGTSIIGSTMTRQLFDLKDLLGASTEVLGKGTVRTTYRATLDSGYKLVVKRLKDVDLEEAVFKRLVTLFGAIQNKHIVPLLWYYCSKDEKLLVYNVVPTGSLAKVLHGDQGSGPGPLDWEQRLAISLAAARGMQAIHLAGPSSCHGNIKSSNILLTGTHDACVSEHGLITLGIYSNASGYRAPEVTRNRWVSQKSDMYSFGILLLELLTRKSPLEKRFQDDGGVHLPRWVCSIIPEEWTAKVFDVELLARGQKDGKEECMVRLMQLGLKCCSQDADSRPTMSDVVQRIEEIGQS